MYSDTKELYEFGNFRLDVNEHRLSFADGTLAPQLPEKAFQTLVLLVRKAGNLVNKQELIAAVWADSIVEENNLDKAIHLIRQALGEKPGEQKYIETVRKHGYRFVAPVNELHIPYERALNHFSNGEFSNERKAIKPVGEPIISTLTTKSGAFVVSAKWNPENKETIIEANGNHQEETPNSDPPRIPGPNQLFWPKWRSLIALTFLLALSVGALSFAIYRSTDRTAVAGTKSIAVLPLKPVNSANRDELYEIGIADSLIYRLGTMKGIIVRPLGATRKYDDVAQDPLAAGKEQQADYVLAANYQVADGKIRITAQLFNVESGKIEETYKTEKDAGNAFALQDAIAGEIGNLLQTRFVLTPNTTMVRRGTTNEEAYRLYLQGRNLATFQRPGGYKKAIERYEEAIKLDPNFAPAYARLAFAYYAGNIAQNSSDNAAKVKEIVNKALELDPNLAEAYVSRGFVSGVYDWDPSAAEKDYLRAIELEPNNEAAHWLYAMNLSNRGRFDEALAEIEIARTIEPAATMHMWHRGQILYSARRYDEAIKQWQQAIDLDDRPQQPYGGLSRVHEIKGDYASAYQFFLKREERSPRRDRLEIYQKTYETAGWIGVRRELAKSLNFDNFDLARLYALQGEKDAAFESLNKAVEKREWHIVTLKVEPAFDNLRNDPRFGDLVKWVGYQ